MRLSNPLNFTPTIYLVPEILIYEGKTVIHVHIPASAEVHSYKKVIYDRLGDADIRVTAAAQIAGLYIRKQNIFTEKKIYPYVTKADLRMDLLPGVKQMAVNHAGGKHPWEGISDDEFFKSAGLYGTDIATGERGFNLAAVMLFGKDDVILNACPAYETDALVRKINVDRYDDREVIRTNLIESFDQLMEFGRKHLSDKFFLEEENRVSLRNILVREMVSNTLMHREFTSSYAAKFVIQQDKMYVENANRAAKEGIITPDNLEPNPKNPIIASFFRNIGRADRLGSGVRNLYKYSKYYSGQEPEFKEGDVFRIVVPLDDEYSFDYAAGRNTTPQVTLQVTPQVTPQVTDYDKILERILKYCSIPRKKSEIMAYCDFKETKNFTKKYLRPLLDAGKITMTIPDKPKSQNQRYVVIENK